MENKDRKQGGLYRDRTAPVGLLPFVCILGFHTCVGKSRTRERQDTKHRDLRAKQALGPRAFYARPKPH